MITHVERIRRSNVQYRSDGKFSLLSFCVMLLRGAEAAAGAVAVQSAAAEQEKRSGQRERGKKGRRQ
jgi:hypothetical protein